MLLVSDKSGVSDEVSPITDGEVVTPAIYGSDQLLSAVKVNPSNRERAAVIVQEILRQRDLKVTLVERDVRAVFTRYDPNAQPKRAVRRDGMFTALGRSDALDDIANVAAGH